MKIVTFVGMILIASMVFVGFNLIVSGEGGFEDSLIETNYTDATPFSDAYETSFNQTAKIHETFNDTVEGLQSLGDEGEWWEELGDFVGAIPVVIIEFPMAIAKVFFDSYDNLQIILNEIGIPPEIILIALAGLIVWLTFKLVNFWKSGEEI